MTTRAQAEFDFALARGNAGTVGVMFPPPGVGPSCDNSDLGDLMVVRAEVTTEVIIPWILPDIVLPDSFNLESEAAFQCEYS